MHVIFGRLVAIRAADRIVVHNYTKRIMDKESKTGSRDQLRGDTVGRIDNNLVGKYGEVGAAAVLGGHIKFDVWKTGSRGIAFDPDVVCNSGRFASCNVHVKTCHLKHGKMSGMYVYPCDTASWTVDVGDPIYVDPSSNDIVVFMFADQYGKVYALGWVYAYQLFYMWRACVSKHMLHKRAVYWPDIQHIVKSF